MKMMIIRPRYDKHAAISAILAILAIIAIIAINPLQQNNDVMKRYLTLTLLYYYCSTVARVGTSARRVGYWGT